MSDDGPGSSWQEHFSITDDLGCALPFIGFVLFLVVALVLWQVFS
jgi:hypothetical protein